MRIDVLMVVIVNCRLECNTMQYGRNLRIFPKNFGTGDGGGGFLQNAWFLSDYIV